MEKGVNWNDQPTGFKRGRMCVKEEYELEVKEGSKMSGLTLTRNRWVVDGAIWITKDRENFSQLVPRMKQEVEYGI